MTSDIMSPKQRDELAGIGNKIITLPHRIITGEIDVKKGFSEFVSALKSLASFFFKHKDIALKIGGKILKSMHPLGSFLKSTVEKVVKSDLSKNLKEGLMRGLNITAEHFGKVEKVLENTVGNKISPRNS